MIDYTKCSGEGCLGRLTCYRYLAPPNKYRQAFFVDPPFEKASEGTRCKYYIECTKEEIAKLITKDQSKS